MPSRFSYTSASGSSSSSGNSGKYINALPSVLVQTPETLISERLEDQSVDGSDHLIHPSRLNQDPTRSTTSPLPSTSSSSSSSLRGSGRRARSRTSTISYTPPLAPVMSRENSLEDDPSQFDGPSSLPGPSSLYPPRSSTPTHNNRKASKSVSNVRPNLNLQTKRAQSYHNSSFSASTTAPMPSLLSSPTPSEGSMNPRTGLKRRISTPSLAMLNQNLEFDRAEGEGGRVKLSATRARSTSTSLVIPEHLQAGPSNPTSPAPPFLSTLTEATPPQPWESTFTSPPTSYDPVQLTEMDSTSTENGGLLASAYNFGESSILRLTKMIRSSRHTPSRRRDSEDSEKALDGSEEEMTIDSYARTSEDSVRKGGKYWGIWNSDEEGDGYFSLPPTPPDEKGAPEMADFEAAIRGASGLRDTLPTPALSTRSLSRSNKREKRDTVDTTSHGWLSTVYRVGASSGTGQKTGRTGAVLRELGWTVGFLVCLFLTTAALALWMIQGMPITQLKHLPTSTTDLQLLSAEIRTYMASDAAGWYHTVGVLTFVGCWKHAWSVPGAVVLNILVGSVFDPVPALLLLTIITATGSLFSYLLSRPLAPLIAVLFPKPLALVRVALAPDSIPAPSYAMREADETLTAIQVSEDPAAAPIGNESKNSVWRRLLIMRAMGFVPWSGMNVACGVVGVDWRVFWLTTAAGSASWSYVTASVGNILSRLAIPSAALDGSAGGDMLEGESLTSLLRDPVLIAKLVFLSALTLLPVVLKRRREGTVSAVPLARSSSASITPPRPLSAVSRIHGASDLTAPMSPTSALTRSLARFTPTPAVFDLLSFGRTAIRQSANVVMTGVRAGLDAGERIVGRRV